MSERGAQDDAIGYLRSRLEEAGVEREEPALARCSAPAPSRRVLGG